MKLGLRQRGFGREKNGEAIPGRGNSTGKRGLKVCTEPDDEPWAGVLEQ